MRTVWKYELEKRDFTVRATAGARVVHVGVQGPAVCLWLEVDPLAKSEDLHLVVYGTGDEIAEGHEHIGTVVMVSGLVWHVYRVKPPHPRRAKAA